MTDEELLIQGLARKKQQEAELADAEEATEKQFTIDQFKSVNEQMIKVSDLMIEFLKSYSPEVSVSNFPDSPEATDNTELIAAVKGLEESLKPVDNSDIISGLKDLSKTVQKMPKTDKVEVSNLSELKTKLSGDLRDILIAIRGLDVKPNVDVKAPIVKVEATDLKPVIKALGAVQKAVDNKPVPGVSVTPTDPWVRYAIADIDIAGATQYFGYTNQQGGWYIRQYDTVAGTFRIAVGNNAYATNFSGRAGLTYSYWG